MSEVSPVTTFSFPELRVVEASAGSGKTYALAKRYVQLLLGTAGLRQILAITFTNKASFEMKGRILDFLKRLALSQFPASEQEGLLGPVQLDAERAAPKAYRLMEALIYHYNFFQVQTIDSFINALLVGSAFKLGLAANFKIRHNAGEYLAASLDQLIERAMQEPDIYRLFTEFLQQYLFLENKAGWFPKDDMLALLSALYQSSNTYGLPFRIYPLQTKDMLALKAHVLASMRELAETLPPETDRRFQKSLKDFLQRYERSFDFDRLSEYFTRPEPPVRKNAVIPPRCAALWNEIHADLTRLSEAEAYGLFNPYVAVFDEVMTNFHAQARRDNVLFLEQLNCKAHELFDDGAMSVAEMYYRLATRFRHYLLDEFQDTSVLQWHNLFPMIEEALSTGGSLFYVGDKKQAIYGFRGGEIQLFDSLPDQLSSFPLQRERLNTNYRSHQAVVGFNNALFAPDNLRRFVRDKEQRDVDKKKKYAVSLTAAELTQLEDVFAGAHQTARADRPGGHVNISYVDGKRKEDRDAVIKEKFLALIEDVRKRYSLRDIAVLTRSNREIEQLTSWLMEVGVFVESERTLNIKGHFLVQELLALLQFLDSPVDNRAFARFVTGELFCRGTGMGAADLHAFLFGQRQNLAARTDTYLYKEFRERFMQTWEVFIEPFFKNIGFYPLYELMVTILYRFDVLAHFPDQQGFIMRFLEVVKMAEEEVPDVAGFLTYFEQLESDDIFVPLVGSNAVRILTIHKAKGLEFPVVIIPFFGMDIQLGSRGGLGQQSFVLDQKADHLELLRIKRKYLAYSERLSDIHRAAYVRALLAELNNVYVALTRTAIELYAFVPERVGSRFNIARLLIPEGQLVCGVPTKSPIKSSHVNAPCALAPSVHRDWLAYLREEFLDVSDLLKHDQRQEGERLHQLLALVGNLQDQNVEAAIQSALSRFQRIFPGVQDPRPYERFLRDVIREPDWSTFFFVPGADVAQEVDVVNAEGHTLRLDRLIVRSKDVWVVDYKTSRESTGLQASQVRTYMRLLESLYPGRIVRGFLLFLTERQVEEVMMDEPAVTERFEERDV